MLKKTFILFALTCVFIVRICAQSKDEKAVAKAVETLRSTMVNPDSVILKNLVCDNLEYGHSSGGVQNKASFIETLINGKSDFVSIELTDQTISISGDVAIVRHVLSAATNDGGHLGSVKLGVLLVWKKSHHHWKLLARQAVKLT